MESLSAIEYGKDNGQFWVRAVPISREPRSWKEELFAAAYAIANGAHKPIWLAMSGGVESEIMARSFFEKGINFSALTLEHTAGTNREEVEHAKVWCFSHGVPHRIVPFDAREFLTTGVDAYMKAGYITGTPYRYLQLKLMEIVEGLGGYAVLGNGKLNIFMREDGDPFARLGASYATAFEWSRDRGSAHQPYFLMSTPELILSYLRIPFVEGAVRTPHAFDNELNNVALRRFVHQAIWPDIESRPQFHGFENEPVLFRDAREKLRTAFRGLNVDVSMPISLLTAQLEGRDQTKSFSGLNHSDGSISR